MEQLKGGKVVERSLKSVALDVLHHSITWVNAVWKYVVQRLVGADFQSTAKLPRVIPTTHRAKSCQYCAFAVGCHPTLNHLRTKSSYRLSLLAVHLHIEVTYHLVAFEGGEYAIVCNILKYPLPFCMYGEFRSAMGANCGLAFMPCVRPLVSTLQTSVFAFRVALGNMFKKVRICPLTLLVGNGGKLDCQLRHLLLKFISWFHFLSSLFYSSRNTYPLSNQYPSSKSSSAYLS